MARRRDLFARLSLDYADHPKIAGLSDAAFRAHVEMILYSRRYLTDGRIAKQIAKRWPEPALSELSANDDETPSLTRAENGDYLIHGFGEMQETRAEVEEKRQIRAEAGRLGGLARAKQSAKRGPSKVPSKDVPETETETETETVSTPAHAAEFETFWDTYGKKVGRKNAEQKYRLALRKPGVTPQLINQAAAAYIAERKASGNFPKYTKDPVVWLNGEHWNDEQPTVAPAPQAIYDQYPRAPRRTA